ncbi:MAG TPA: response regulator transcription factor [Gemmatimonadales bacterium]|nr:response regulator transcription factor [Gemmatimonadales bacterium]
MPLPDRPDPITPPPAGRPISLVLIDDRRTIRDGVARRIRALPDFLVLATSAEVEEALRVVREAHPDVVLMDFGHRSHDRLTLAGALHRDAPESRLVVMGVRGPNTNLVGLVRAGVSGFIMVDANLSTYLATIQTVARGEPMLPLELTQTLFEQLSRRGERRQLLRNAVRRRLTPREHVVAGLIAQGLSNRDIAIRLMIAVQTVKAHVHRVLDKLAVNSRFDVARFTETGTPSVFDPQLPVAHAISA